MLMERGKDQVSAEEDLAKNCHHMTLADPSLSQGLLGATAVKRRGLNDLLAASLGHCGYNRTMVQEEWDRKSFSLKVNAINCLWSFSLI